MKFGAVPLNKAIGATLAHGIAVGEQRFGKGRVLSTQDVELLGKAGCANVNVARLGKKDVPENEAAARIGAQLATSNIIAKTASTGRVNLHSNEAGLLRVNAKKINAINALHPSITLATLADFTVCQQGAIVATVKIIPFAAPQSAVEKAENLSARNALELHPFKPLNVGLIQTTLPLTKDSVLEKTADVTRQRVTGFGGSIDVAAHCNHDGDSLAETLHSLLGLDMLIVFGASAVCDNEDVIPLAIRLIGGKVTQVGMPVDPGNLLVLGSKGKTIIIGAPGCARSPKENGFDWVLARLFAGLKVTSRDIIGMGVGGLLLEIPTRPSPRSVGERSASELNEQAND
jgi:molybdenum cofactor cytidylyltransferase